MNTWQLVFGSGISFSAALIFLTAVAGELALMSCLLDRYEQLLQKARDERLRQEAEEQAA